MMHAGLYVASPVEDYLLLIHVGHEDGAGGLGEGEQNLAQLVTSALRHRMPNAACLACSRPAPLSESARLGPPKGPVLQRGWGAAAASCAMMWDTHTHTSSR